MPSLASGVQALHGLGGDVRGGVPQDGQPVRAVDQDRLDRRALGELQVQVAQLAVRPGRRRRRGRRRTGRGRWWSVDHLLLAPIRTTMVIDMLATALTPFSLVPAPLGRLGPDAQKPSLSVDNEGSRSWAILGSNQ